MGIREVGYITSKVPMMYLGMKMQQARCEWCVIQCGMQQI